MVALVVDRWLAELAESLGHHSWWASDHVVLPSPRVDPSPSEPDTVIVDPLAHLSYVAAVTSRLRLATGIVILPQRNPHAFPRPSNVRVVVGGHSPSAWTSW